jgi:hypothetical protein
LALHVEAELVRADPVFGVTEISIFRSETDTLTRKNASDENCLKAADVHHSNQQESNHEASKQALCGMQPAVPG